MSGHAVHASGTNPAVLLGLTFCGLGVITANPLLTATAGVAFSIVWWGALGNPLRSVVACLLSAQWLQASAKLWVANIWGVSLDEPSIVRITSYASIEVTDQTSQAIALALAGVAMVSIGAQLASPRLRISPQDFASLTPGGLALLYLPLLVLSKLPATVFPAPLLQLLEAMGALRFVPVVLLMGLWFFSKRGGVYLAAILLTEVLLGFLSYFSAWKHILILCGITLVAVSGRAWRRALPLIAGGLAVLLVLGVLWTIVKPTYRSTLNQGTGQQVVLLSPLEQGAALSREVGRVEATDLSEGFLQLLERISYVDYLADVLTNVPAQVSYQDGALWGEALQQFLTPRFLFPNKPRLPSDSERTMQFTGRGLASDAEGTSISIGYVGESYIDFGIPGALIIPLLLGLAYGLSMLALVRLGQSRNAAVLLSVSMPLLWHVQQFEISNIKLVGALTWSWISCALFLLLLWPRLAPLISARRVAPATAPSSGLKLSAGRD